MAENIRNEIIETMINSIDLNYQYRVLDKMIDNVTDLVSKYEESVLKDIISDRITRRIINLNLLFIRSDSEEVCQTIIKIVEQDNDLSTYLLEAIEQEDLVDWKREMIKKMEADME